MGPLRSLYTNLTLPLSPLECRRPHQSLHRFGEKKMADGFGCGSFSGVPYPYWLSSPSPHPPASAPPFLPSNPVESYDPTQEMFGPMIYHRSYQRSPADWSNCSSYPENYRSQTPSSSLYADNSRLGKNCGPGDEGSSKSVFLPSGFYSSRESSSENFSERQRLNFVPTYNSATLAPVSSYAEMLIRNSQEPFFTPITSSGVYASTSALDDKRPGYYFPCSDGPETMNVASASLVEPYLCTTDCNPSLSMSDLRTQDLFDGSQTGTYVGDGSSFPNKSNAGSHAPENLIGVQSSLHGSSVEPVNFDVLLGYGEATGHIKPLPENPDLSWSSHPLPSNINSSLIRDKREGSSTSSLYQRPYHLADNSENGISESSLKNAIEDLNCYEPRSWSHFMVSSEGPSAPTMISMGSESGGAMKANNENVQSTVNNKPPSEGSTIQPSEDVPTNQKPCKLQEQTVDVMNKDMKTGLLTDLGLDLSTRSITDNVSTGRSPEKHLCDQGDFPAPTSSPRVSSVVNAMHNLSELLVYECFNNGSWLKLEQLENLDKVVDNLTKCLKKITGDKTTAGEASVPTQAMYVTFPNVVELNEATKGVTTGCQGFSVKPLDSSGVKEPVDQNEMTQSIKNILASNFTDGEENEHPQTLLYKNLWLETEAALCSASCMARYHRIKNEIGNRKFNNKEISTDAATFMQEPPLDYQKSVAIMKKANVEPEKTESIIKHGSNCGKNVVTMSHDEPQSSKFNSDPVMSRSFTSGLEQIIHGNLRPDAGKKPAPVSSTENNHNDVMERLKILLKQETERKLKSQKFPDSDIDVINQFQNPNEQETNLKRNTQNWPETKMVEREENTDASVMANIGSSSHVSDVIDRFKILKRREAEQRSLNSLDINSVPENDQTQMCDDLWLASMLTDSQVEGSAVDKEQSASGKGYESPTSDWEHVPNDD